MAASFSTGKVEDVGLETPGRTFGEPAESGVDLRSLMGKVLSTNQKVAPSGVDVVFQLEDDRLTGKAFLKGRLA